MVRKLVFAAVIAMFFAGEAMATSIGDIMPVLKKAKQDIKATLSEIDTDLKAAAAKLSAMDLKSDDARKVLLGLKKFRPYVLSCSILDADAIKITVEPEEFRNLEGSDRSGDQYVIKLFKEKKPNMTTVYHSSEGAHAISIGYPILASDGSMKGAVRMLIRHEIFLQPLLDDRPCKLWAMQPNGLIVYDPHSEEIGRNIFDDPVYKPFPDLISFSRTVALSPNGAGSYKFYENSLSDKTAVEKTAAWDTVGLYGTDWRIIGMEVESAPEEEAPVQAASGKETKAISKK